LKHVVVIGAGVVGLCVADALLARGFRVTVLEKDTAPGEGCSFGNGGIIVPSHFVPLAAPGMVTLGLRMLLNPESPFGIERVTDLATLGWLVAFARAGTAAHVARCAPLLRDLNLASRELYASWSEDLGFAKRGLLMLSRTVEGQAAEVRLAESAQRLGLNATVLTASELAQKEPGLTMDVHGAVCFEDDAHVTTGAAMRALRHRVVARGGTIREGATVTGIRRSGSAIEAVRLTDDEVTGDEFVLAAGAWSGEVARQVGLRLPMVAGKGYGLTVPTPPQAISTPAILTEARIAVTPMQDGVRFVGTFSVAKPVATPATRRVAAMRRSVGEYYPAFTANVVDGPVWCGLRPCSPDGMPYLGRTAKVSNLVVASGHAMMGMSLGPVSGQIIAEIVAGDPPTFPLPLLSPDRYA
jgi:D-amino-acid dehydrogenase